ncbi:hypothetical protein SAMN04487843_12591 [Methylobacterium sp. ap11]|nr:hypothetical protein [Methylobacterium sp. ap11]SEP47723.1 hypothetical protein SAMN04487843_12591 [Methylobacterium sp. ap11]
MADRFEAPVGGGVAEVAGRTAALVQELNGAVAKIGGIADRIR